MKLEMHGKNRKVTRLMKRLNRAIGEECCHHAVVTINAYLDGGLRLELNITPTYIGSKLIDEGKTIAEGSFDEVLAELKEIPF